MAVLSPSCDPHGVHPLGLSGSVDDVGTLHALYPQSTLPHWLRASLRVLLGADPHPQPLRGLLLVFGGYTGSVIQPLPGPFPCSSPWVSHLPHFLSPIPSSRKLSLTWRQSLGMPSQHLLEAVVLWFRPVLLSEPPGARVAGSLSHVPSTCTGSGTGGPPGGRLCE